MRAPLRLLIATLVALAAVSARGPASDAQPREGWRADVDAMLGRRAAALLAGDEQTYRATMAAAPASWRSDRAAAARRLRALDPSVYTLRIDPDHYAEFPPAPGDRPAGDEMHVVPVIERVALRGLDAEPAENVAYLTVVRRGTTWSVAGDDDVEDLGLRSARWIWDGGAVTRTERTRVVVLSHGSAGTARRLADVTVAARPRIARAWPARWDEPIVILVPRSTDELARLLDTTFDLSPFVAFLGSSVTRPEGGYRLGGHRMYIQPATFFATSSSFQRLTIEHELLHHATRAHASPHTPAWLDEGVAQRYGERPPPSTARFARAVRAGSRPKRLPTDAEFITGGEDAIKLSYEAAASFVAYLDRVHGSRSGATLYLALGAQTAVAPGTSGYHLDRAVRATFGTSLRALERAWIRSIEKG